MPTNHVITFTHLDEVQHVRAANAIGRGADSRPDPRTSVWTFGDDEMAAQQAEARLRGDLPEITCEKRAVEVSSGALPTGTTLNPHG